MSVIYQALCTFIVCWVRMSLVISFSWPAFTTALFRSQNTPLHRPMTEFEAALFGSMTSIGALIFTPFFGLLLDGIGRKKCMILAAVTHMCAWIIVVSTNQVEALLASMFVAGLGIGSFVAIPVYISEVCQPSIRGAMTSCMMLAFGVGMLCSYLLGGYLEYSINCYVCLTVSSLAVIMTMMLKESPVFLMRKGREEEAEKAMAYYRNTTINSKIVMQEIDQIRKTLGGTQEVSTKEVDESKAMPVQNLSFWQFIRSSRSTRKAAMLSMTLLILSMFHGYVVLCVYAGSLFKEAVPSLSPVLCSVLVALVSIGASLMSAYLVDALGRRPLMVYSSLGSGVCCVLLATQIQLGWGPHVMTAVVIFLFCFIYQVGAGAVPFVLAAEVFLPEASSILSMVAYELTWLATFVVLFVFSPLISWLGLAGVFYLFAIICFCTVGFASYFLPETKGLTVDAIQKLF